jgi:hypothetical protein
MVLVREVAGGEIVKEHAYGANIVYTCIQMENETC